VQFPRREFVKDLFAIGAMQGVFAIPTAAHGLDALISQGAAAPNSNTGAEHPDDFWLNFAYATAKPVLPVAAVGPSRGGTPEEDQEAEKQPVFLHYSSESGFNYAQNLDASKLTPEGDVIVSLNTSTLKVSADDQETFHKYKNAQVRVDVSQAHRVLPFMEQMSYALVAGMHAAEPTKLGKPAPSVQALSIESDPTWASMQQIPLPNGEGRWALNLEAQRAESALSHFITNMLRVAGEFAPVLGLPGVALSAINSFNGLYNSLRAMPVAIFRGNPVRVFATREALAKTGSPGSVTGMLLQSGTYILIDAKRCPVLDDLKPYTVRQGRIVPPSTSPTELDEAAADTLPNVTYATFDVEVTPATLLKTPPEKSPA